MSSINPADQNATIWIVVNDQPMSIRPDTTLQELLNDLGIKTPAIAVELNQQIQPRKAFAQTVLKLDDNLEIVTMVGGG